MFYLIKRKIVYLTFQIPPDWNAEKVMKIQIANNSKLFDNSKTKCVFVEHESEKWDNGIKMEF